MASGEKWISNKEISFSREWFRCKMLPQNSAMALSMLPGIFFKFHLGKTSACWSSENCKWKQTDLGIKCTQGCWYCELQSVTWRWNEMTTSEVCPSVLQVRTFSGGDWWVGAVFWIPPFTLTVDDLPSYHYITCKARSYKSKCSALPPCTVFLQVQKKIELILYTTWRQPLK